MLHYLVKSEIQYIRVSETIPSCLIFLSFRPLRGRRTVRIWTPSTTRCGDPTKACVQAPQDHERRRAAPACWGLGPSGPGSDWQRDQWMAQVTDSLHCSRRTFWTFILNITAFVHILIDMFWTLLTLLSVKQINFYRTNNSLAVTVNSRISQGSVAA